MLLHRRQVRQHADAAALEPCADQLMGGVDRVEVVLAVRRLEEQRGAAQRLDRRVVHLAAEQHLGVAVQQRCACAPEAVPEE